MTTTATAKDADTGTLDLERFKPVIQDFLTAIKVDPDLAIKIIRQANAVHHKRETWNIRTQLKKRYTPLVTKSGPNSAGSIRGWKLNQELLDWLVTQERTTPDLTLSGSGRRKRFSNRADAIATAHELHADGFSLKEIALELGVSDVTVGKYLKL